MHAATASRARLRLLFASALNKIAPAGVIMV